MAVDDIDPRIEEMQTDWRIINDLLGGTKQMRKMGKIYLPQHAAEDDQTYTNRLNCSVLLNGLGRTITTLAAKPFSEPLVYDDSNPDVANWIDNIDLQGQDIHNFAHQCMLVGLAKGLCHIWIDYPRVEQGATVYDVRSQNVRPYLILVKPDQVLGWKTTRINGYDVLTQVRFTTTYCPESDNYVPGEVKRINVLEKRPDVDGVVWEAWEQSGNEFVLVDQAVITQDNIPFVTFYAKRTGYMTARPPLMDVAYLNVAHWQSASDQRNITTIARVPILFGAGFSTDDPALPIGSSKMIRSTNADAKLAFVEHSGKAIEAGRQDIHDLEDQMRSMGAELLRAREDPNDPTATQVATESDATTCDLAQMAEALQDTLNMALEFAAAFAGTPDNPGTVKIFRDFAVEMPQPSDMDTLLKMNVAGIISMETVFKEAQRRDVLSDQLEFEDEQSLVENELPALTARNATVVETPDGTAPAPTAPNGNVQ